jgi:hypothetical protein
MMGDTRLVGVLLALCMAAAGPAGAGHRPDDQSEAANVAKKVGRAAAAAHQAEEEREALRHFQDEVAEYAALHATQLAKLGREESVSTQKALAHAMQRKRAKAKPGDIFRPDVQPVFRRLIAEQLEGPGTADAGRTVLEGNPGDEKPVAILVRVNGEYPIGASWSTVPPSLLMTLPTLPGALHYRFVDRDLLLVDSVAQLIVDVLPAAAPEPAARELP